MSGSQSADKAQAALHKGAVTTVTQTCMRLEFADAFARGQGKTSKLIAGFPGSIEQKVLPPCRMRALAFEVFNVGRAPSCASSAVPTLVAGVSPAPESVN
jgi:hypothetical protein